MLTENHISKYNVGNSDFTAPSTDKTVILVPGQVEDDASIRYGSPQIYHNWICSVPYANETPMPISSTNRIPM